MPLTEPERLTHNTFCERYQFFKVRSREAVGPKELRQLMVATLGRSFLTRDLSLHQRRDLVSELLACDAWLRSRTGYALPRLLEDAESAAFHFITDAKVREEHPELGKHLDWKR